MKINWGRLIPVIGIALLGAAQALWQNKQDSELMVEAAKEGVRQYKLELEEAEKETKESE